MNRKERRAAAKQGANSLAEIRRDHLDTLKEIADDERKIFAKAGKDGYTISEALEELRDCGALRMELLSDIAHFAAMREQGTVEAGERRTTLSWDYDVLGKFDADDPFLQMIKARHEEFVQHLTTAAALAGGKKIDFK